MHLLPIFLIAQIIACNIKSVWPTFYV